MVVKEGSEVENARKLNYRGLYQYLDDRPVTQWR